MKCTFSDVHSNFQLGKKYFLSEEIYVTDVNIMILNLDGSKKMLHGENLKSTQGADSLLPAVWHLKLSIY